MRTTSVFCMSYEPYEQLIAPARPTKGLGRLFAGFGALIFFFILLALTLSRVQSVIIPTEHHAQYFAELDTGATPIAMLLNLFFFLVMIIALWLAMWLVNHRTLRSLLGSPSLAIKQFKRVLGFVFLLYVALILLPAPAELQTTPNLDPRVWLTFLPFALIGLLIQVSAEEMVFRGYLQSQLAARFSNPVIWMAIPSALFALLHYGNATESASAWLMVVWAAAFGLAAADLTARSGTLGPAIALHFINNFSALLITAPENNFDGLALFTIPLSVDDSDLLMMWMPVELMVLLCSWLAARLALRC